MKKEVIKEKFLYIVINMVLAGLLGLVTAILYGTNGDPRLIWWR